MSEIWSDTKKRNKIGLLCDGLKTVVVQWRQATDSETSEEEDEDEVYVHVCIKSNKKKKIGKKRFQLPSSN